MTRIVQVLILLGVAATQLNGCASLQDIDQSEINHPAMDLHNSLTPGRSSYLTNLGALTQTNKSSGACPSCAH